MNWSESRVIDICRKMFPPNADKSFYAKLMLELEPAILMDSAVISRESVRSKAEMDELLEKILEACQFIFRIDNAGIRRQNENYVSARYFFFYFARATTSHSLKYIGEWINPADPFDHATVLHGFNRIKHYISVYPEHRHIYQQIKDKIEEK